MPQVILMGFYYGLMRVNLVNAYVHTHARAHTIDETGKQVEFTLHYFVAAELLELSSIHDNH